MTIPASLNSPNWFDRHHTHVADGGFIEMGPDSDRSGRPSGPWHRGEQITVSFAPDGTDILGKPSELYSTFAWMLSASELEETVLKAFQVWARTTNLNAGLVSDDGTAFGTNGFEQHDLRFGDVRVGAIPMAADVYAVSIPADDLASGTWSGDIIFNSAIPFGSMRTFYQVALHEAGHVLGLGHSSDPNSPMYRTGSSIQITANDVASLRAIYGLRELDHNEEEAENNNSFEEATHFEFPGGQEKGETPLVAFGDLAASDIDYFRLDVPSDYSGRVTFRLQSTGLSLLSPKLSIYDESFNLIRQVRSDSKTGSDLLTSLPSTPEGARYYAAVTADPEVGVFGMGTYAIGAMLNDNLIMGWNRAQSLIANGYFNLEDQSDFQEALYDPTVLIGADLGANDTFGTAQTLATTPGFEDQRRYELQGSIATAADLDYYVVRTTKTGVLGKTNMTVRIDSLETRSLIPDVQVYDQQMNRLNAAVLVNGNGQLSVQVKNLPTNTDFVVRVAGNSVNSSFRTGNYRMTVDFQDTSARFQRFGAGTLQQSDNVADHSLFVAESQMLHVNFLAQMNLQIPEAVLWMTIYDENQNVVYRSATAPGQTRTTNSTLFAPGSYAVRVELVLPDGTFSNAPINYLIRGRRISDGQGPKLLDSTASPFDQCDPTSPDYCYPNNNHSSKPFLFVDGGYVPVDANGTPWTDVNNWYWTDQWLDPVAPG